MLAEVEAAPVKNLVVDFSQSHYFGTDALGLFLQLWKKMGRRGGRVVFCGASEFGNEILRQAKFDHLGLICDSRTEAIEALVS
jgi:anti-anti-sigma regulatory factor